MTYKIHKSTAKSYPVMVDDDTICYLVADACINRHLIVKYFKATGISGVYIDTPNTISDDYYESSFLDLLILTGISYEEVVYWIQNMPIPSLVMRYPGEKGEMKTLKVY